MVRNGVLITPPVTDNILEGIVRQSLIGIAGDQQIPLEVRSIDRTELYVADELFLCGTGAQLSPVTSVDHRKVGTGGLGPITQQLSRIYFDAVRGKSDRYKGWVTPVYPT
jgi:branched-chain amino acid aminotransferase